MSEQTKFTPDMRETLDTLAEDGLLLDPSVADAAEVLGHVHDVLAQSLAEPHALRTPDNTRRTLSGLTEVVVALTNTVQRVADWYPHASKRGDIAGDTTQLVEQLRGATQTLGEAVAPLQKATAGAATVTYTGPEFGTYPQQIHGILAELRRRGATVTVDPTQFDDFEEPEIGDYTIQFTLPDNSETFGFGVGPDVRGEPELTGRDIHPAVIVNAVLANLESYVATPIP